MTNRQILIDNLNSYFDGFWTKKGIDIEVDFEKVPTNKFNASMIYLYECYVNTLEIFNPEKGLRMYSAADFVNLLSWYITRALDLNFISLYGFSLLINRNIYFVQRIKDSMDPESTNDEFIFEAEDLEYFQNMPYINTLNNSVLCSNKKESILNDFNSTFEGDCKGGNLARTPVFDAVKKLYEYIQAATVSKLNDSNVGLIVNANNNKDVGLMYAKETAIEVQKARQKLSISELPLLD